MQLSARALQILFLALLLSHLVLESSDGAESETMQALQQYLATSPNVRGSVAKLPFAKVPLSRGESEAANRLIAADRAAMLRESRRGEMDARELVDGELRMPFFYTVSGDKPEKGRSLYLSMHGGGGAPKQVNDRQWENQKRLYKVDEGVYVAPRAPTDTWNLWHQEHIDRLFSRLIEDMILFEDVDPDRVYLTGYSAGGDGVYQLAPRMSDRFAAAAMMAGHPNETIPIGLRNIPFSLHMGANDSAYNRNEIAKQWKEKLAELRGDDPSGYEHEVVIHSGKGHWMDREDAVAMPWMATHRRVTFPSRVVWRQDDVTHERLYWLSVPAGAAVGGSLVVANVKANTITFESAEGVDRLTLLLSDAFVDLDRPIEVILPDKTVVTQTVSRTIQSIVDSYDSRYDPTAVWTATLDCRLTGTK